MSNARTKTVAISTGNVRMMSLRDAKRLDSEKSDKRQGEEALLSSTDTYSDCTIQTHKKGIKKKSGKERGHSCFKYVENDLKDLLT